MILFSPEILIVLVIIVVRNLGPIRKLVEEIIGACGVLVGDSRGVERQMMPPLFQESPQVLRDSDVVEIVVLCEVFVVVVHQACFRTQGEGDGYEEVKAHFGFGFRG